MKTRRLSMTSVLLLMGLAQTIFAGAALAQRRPGIQPFVDVPEGCYLTKPPDTGNLFSFTRMQIQALWMARMGEQADQDVLTSQADLPMNRMAEMIRGMRKEHIEDTCAEFIVSPYAGSVIENAATVAKILSSGYQQLGDMTDQMLGIILQSTRDINGSATRDRLAQWKGKRRGIMETMAAALNVSLSMLVDESRKDSEGKADHLILTRAQRDELLKLLDSKFPALVNEKKVGHSGDFLEQALLIQSFLSGNLKPADSQ